VKEDCGFVALQFKCYSHTQHARMEYFVILTILNRSTFLKVYVTDMMKCNTFIRGSKFTTENMQFSRWSLNIMMASYWLWHKLQ